MRAPRGAFQRAQGIVSKLTGQTIPGPGVWTARTPRLGIFVAVGAGGKGEVETLVWESWAADPANTAARKCVENFVVCMKAANLEAHSPDKGLISALLAIRNDDDPRLGPGARRKVFDLGRSEFGALRDFLTGF